MWSVEHADCLDEMGKMPDDCVDAFVFDPPFTAAGGSTNGRSSGHAADVQFFGHWFRAVFAEVARLTRDDGCGFICCDWRTLPVLEDCIRGSSVQYCVSGWRLSQPLVWDRGSFGMGSPFRNQWEMIGFVRGPNWDRGSFPRNLPNITHHRWPYGQHAHHPAEKPVPLMRQLVQWATWDRGSVVLDPFAGSGTVGVACALEGRGYLGIEIDEVVAATARARIANATTEPEAPPLRKMQASLFEATPAPVGHNNERE